MKGNEGNDSAEYSQRLNCVNCAGGIAVETLTERLRAAKIIAILRRMPKEAVNSIADALSTAGIQVLEITFGSDHTPEAIFEVKRRLGDRALVGAGTVMSVSQVDAAVDAGAEFLLSPHFNAGLVRYAEERGVPFIPGVTTPTEIAAALELGVRVLKLFPAGAMGPSYLKDLKGPFRDVDFIPTGGVGKENGLAFFRAGALALGMGGLLVDEQYVRRGDFSGLTSHARAMLAAVSEAKTAQA
jgi:2-dehydro-3-deoxyphosphogluconate aldolase/(4S)-4-hydroxy-2-oxoglutarate aldolase